MLNVSTERTDDLMVVKIRGRLVRGQEAALETAIVSSRRAQVILLDLSEVELMDAGGLNQLVALHGWATQNRIELKLVNPRPFVYEMLTRTHLDCIFDISTFESVLAALGCECRQAQVSA
jgi:anti-anti-sigma factor